MTSYLKELVEAKRMSERNLPKIHMFFDGLGLTMVEESGMIKNCFEWVNQQN